LPNIHKNNAPLNYAAGLDLGQYEEVLAVLGLKGDLKRWYRDQSYCIEIATINFSEKYLALPWTRDLNAVEDVLVEFFSTRTHITGKAIRELAEQRPGCLILCITDTHIQNLYQEWDDIKKASEAGNFVLFCIDQAYKDKHVEEALASLGRVYYINRLEDLVSRVVDVTGRAYCGESFISLQ